ncbi:MAG: hypothetical protein PHT75_05075 [Bacilli bacterium]|nr:hypothetical protein [Bacilli bacterium]
MHKEKELLEIIRNLIKNERKFYIAVADQLSIEEYQYIERALIGMRCYNCTNGCCRVPSYEKYGDAGDGCIGWQNREYVGRSKVLRERNILKLK